MLFSPLDQFQITALIPLKMFCLDFSISNLVIINSLVLFFTYFLVFTVSSKKKSSEILEKSFFPSNWQLLIEIISNLILNLSFENLNLKGEKYFPFILVVFLFILFCNLIGLIPYSFTLTSHLIITFTLALGIFIGINIICVKEHGVNMFSLFIPANTSFALALLLVPIEFISYVFRPVSLGIRLFANLMAGHTLLKVVVGFAWSMLLLENFLSFFHVGPLIILVFLMGLELAVAIIQTYVFTILICIYLNDGLNLH